MVFTQVHSFPLMPDFLGLCFSPNELLMYSLLSPLLTFLHTVAAFVEILARPQVGSLAVLQHKGSSFLGSQQNRSHLTLFFSSVKKASHLRVW